MYDHLLFDADGTIYDFMACEQFALKNLFTEANLIVTDEMLEQYHQINYQLWTDLEMGLITLEALKTERFRRFFSANSVDFDSLKASDLYLHYLSQSYHLYEDTIDVLNEIQKMGLHMSMITNGIAHVQRGRIMATKTSHFFSFIAIGEELGALKPNAQFFTKTFEHLKRLDLPFSSPLVIGDSIQSDIEGAKNAHLESCWINRYNMEEPEVKHYTYHIRKLEELLEILNSH